MLPKKLIIMKKYSFILLFSAGLSLFSCTDKNIIHEGGGKPNIILIMTDDQGIGDVGYMDNPYVKTPVIDSLASNAIILTNFYVSPVCAPTRSSLLTGRYSVRTGIHDTYNGGAIMATDEYTLAEVLSDNGYITGMFGKWHLGDNYPFRPSDQGFDVSLYHKSGGIGQVGDIDNYFRFDSSYFDPALYFNNELVHTKGYCTDVFTKYAIEFINENKDKPFFLYLAFNAPHTPLQLPQEYLDMYRGIEKLVQSENDAKFFATKLNDQELESTKRVYGMVSNIDDNIGYIIKTLENNNLDKNTVIIFLTDNGPQQNRYKYGLRGLKGSVYEGGIKVPAFIIYPGKGVGNINHTLAHIDILPTILELSKIDFVQGNKIDGISFAPLLDGREVDTFQFRPLIYNWQRGFPEPYRNIAVRKGDYKLVGNISSTDPPSKFELFNISNDPYEKEDISAREPEIVTDLKEEFDNWYMDIILNEKLKGQYAIIGSGQSETVILNRNDASGEPGIWSQDEIFGYWFIECAEPGKYDILASFRTPLDNGGSLIIKIPPIQRTINVTQPGLSEVVIEDVYIPTGKYRVESWFHTNNGRRILPFYLTIKEEVKN